MVTTLKAALKKLLGDELNVPRIVESLKVYEAWQRTAGKKLLDNASFEKFSEGVLYLGIRNSAWAQQVAMLKRRSIDALNKELGAQFVKDIRVKTASDDEKKEQPKKERKCDSCGADFFSVSDGTCPICTRKQGEARLTKLYRLLSKDPKAAYRAVLGEMPGLTEDEFKRVKRNSKEMKIDMIVMEGRSRGKKVGKTGSI